MAVESLFINGEMIPHKIVPIIGDGACLFRSLSYLMYSTELGAQEVRELIVRHVVTNWNEFHIMSHDSNGDNYASSSDYANDMLLPSTYGGLSELVAAAQLFNFVFEVYRNRQLYERFGNEGPTKRLRFTHDLSNGHFDVYVPQEIDEIHASCSQTNIPLDILDASIIPSITNKDMMQNIEHPISRRKQQLRDAARKYSQKNPTVHRAAANRYQRKNPHKHNMAANVYQKNNPKSHRNSVEKYQRNNTKLHRQAVKKYQKNNPTLHRIAVEKYQKNNPNLHRRAVEKYQKNKPKLHRISTAKYQKKHPEVHKAAESRYERKNPRQREERRLLPWNVKTNAGMTYDPEIDYENDSMILLGKMTNQCVYCNALKWKDEALGMCCSAGKVQLPPFKSLPEPLYSLLTNIHPDSVHFMDRIRKFNSCFQMTSFGAKQIIESGFMPMFKVQGQVYHLVGSLFPALEREAQFLQIYFVGEDDREVHIRCSNFPDLHQRLVKELQNMLHHVNSYIRDLRTALNKLPPNCHKFEVVIHADENPIRGHRGCFNAPITNEVALVMVGQQFEKRDIVLQGHDNTLRRISEIHRSYDALQYPLLFPRGEDGYSIALAQCDPKTKMPLKRMISAAAFYSYRIMMRKGQENHLMYCRSLFNQFLVDMYAKIETERLNYIRHNQARLRAENYIHLMDAIGKHDADADQFGQTVVLPSSFTGGPRYMYERFQDAMTYVRHKGRPDLFITFTCNPRWQDIVDALMPLQRPYDRPDIIARVFYLKVKKLMALLKKGRLFGTVQCYMHSVEWQKRGLPHIHILLWLEKRIGSDMIDNVISAEIPDFKEDPLLHGIIKANMIHGPCGSVNYNSPCMKRGNCSKRYPRPLLAETQTGGDGYPQYRRRSPTDGGFTIKMNNMEVDNRWVVPYNPVLSRTFNAHINVESCSSIKSIKYICNYLNKGKDLATFTVENKKDEPKLYESGRYINSSEAVWRILTFPIHERFPTVVPLSVHLENGQRVYFTSDNLKEKLNKPPQTTLLAFFQLCEKDFFAKTLLYCEVPSYFIWTNNEFIRRKRGRDVDGWSDVKKDDALGRVYTIHPNNTECYHLRLLLHEVRGPTSFLELKTVNGIVHRTFQSACKARGLLEDDNHWDITLEEAAFCNSAYKLRELFTVMLVFCQVSDPLTLWEKYKDSLSEDMIRKLEKEVEGTSQNVIDEVYNKALILIEDAVLSLNGQGLQHYGLIQPKRSERHDINRDYLRETSYDVSTLVKIALNNERSLTDEQLSIYQQVLNSVESEIGQIFFLDAPAGTGKTFLINSLLTKIRSNRAIALGVASSGMAATLILGGKTAHSAFKLPFNLIHSETPMCNISKQSNMAKVLLDCKLIVWDESTMIHKGGFEALNRTLKDIRGNDKLMGGVTVLLAGDFRQTLPVVPRGTPADEIKACIQTSYLWPLIRKFSLTKNMRVHLKHDFSAADFSALLLKIGNGDCANLNGKVTIPEGLGLLVTTLTELIESVYPDIVNIKNKSLEWLYQRVILTPKNESAACINDILIRKFDGEEKEYKSLNTVLEIDNAVHYPIEFLNSLNPPGLPSHKLLLKIGAPVMLIRNLSPPKLCNGTKMRVKALYNNVIEAAVLTGHNREESVFIPRIPLVPSDYPIPFKRLQFPLKVCFAMTINKSQGQSLEITGIDLRDDCFSHGQFYVACSRVSSPNSLVILAPEGKTANVVYKQVLKKS